MVERELKILTSRAASRTICMTTNQCMVGECPRGRNPVKCFIKLNELRSQIEDTIAGVTPEGGEAWTGKFSVTSTNNTPR
jgi:hypothetical protein